MDHSQNNISNSDDNETKQELLNDAWIKDYLIPKLINDGKIFNAHGSQTVITSENINVNDNNNTSSCHANSRISNDDKRNQIQVVSVNVKPVSIDGFMLSAPSKVEIEFSYESGDKCEAGSKSQQVVFDKVYLVVKVGVLM